MRHVCTPVSACVRCVPGKILGSTQEYTALTCCAQLHVDEKAFIHNPLFRLQLIRVLEIERGVQRS